MATVIDEDIEIKLEGGGRVYLENVGAKAWLAQVEYDAKNDEERAMSIVPLITRVEDVHYKNGDPMTVESLREGRAPVGFLTTVRAAWARRLFKSVQVEAEAKNG